MAMHLGMFVCMSARTRNSKTFAPNDLIFLHKKYYTSESVLPTWLGILIWTLKGLCTIDRDIR